MEDPRIISTQFNSPKMPYFNVLVNTHIPFAFRAISLRAAFYVFCTHLPIPPFPVVLKTPIDSALRRKKTSSYCGLC